MPTSLVTDADVSTNGNDVSSTQKNLPTDNNEGTSAPTDTDETRNTDIEETVGDEGTNAPSAAPTQADELIVLG